MATLDELWLEFQNAKQAYNEFWLPLEEHYRQHQNWDSPEVDVMEARRALTGLDSGQDNFMDAWGSH